jgi:hypothetical protein
MSTKAKGKKTLKVEFDKDHFMCTEMDWIIETMSDEVGIGIPFVSYNPKKEAKFKRKMLKAAKRIRKWYTVPDKSEVNE